ELVQDQKRRELAEVVKRFDGLVDAIADGLRTPGLKGKLEGLEQRRAALEMEIAAAPPPAPRLHPNLAELYKRKVAALAAALKDPNTRDEAVTIIRSLIERVELHPTKDGFDIDFFGEIAAMIALPEAGMRRDIDHFRVSAKRVAGAGYQRYLQL